MEKLKFNYKPILKAGSIHSTEEGVWTQCAARLDKFNYWKLKELNGESVFVENWSCSIDVPDSNGNFDPDRRFNTYKQKDFIIDEKLLAERKKEEEGAPARYAETCEAAQEKADQQNEPFALYESEAGFYKTVQFRFIPPDFPILNVFYPVRLPRKRSFGIVTK